MPIYILYKHRTRNLKVDEIRLCWIETQNNFCLHFFLLLLWIEVKILYDEMKEKAQVRKSEHCNLKKMDLDYELELLLISVPLCDSLASFLPTFNTHFWLLRWSYYVRNLGYLLKLQSIGKAWKTKGNSHFSRRDKEMIQRIEDKLVISRTIHLQSSLEFIYRILHNLHKYHYGKGNWNLESLHKIKDIQSK